MIFTTDRVQFKDEKFIVFEFYDIEKDEEYKSYIKMKMEYLKNVELFDVCYFIAHKNKFKKFRVIKYDNLTKEKQDTKMNFNEFKKWFCEINGSSSRSKPLTSEGDKYVQNILNRVNGEFDFRNDDNGIELTKKTLSGNVTTGFDFDLFETESKSIIEFLKRDSEYLDNKKAHPARYPWNYQKFTSLWNARNRIDGELFLVNYSNDGTDKDKEISVIKVIDYSTEDKKIVSDIGYLLNGFDDLVKWLKLLENSSEEAKEYLEEKPRQVRNENWWENVYSDFDSNRHMIGEEYEEYI
ncbi:hypothetical protein CBF34_10355 [Vagococcus penaei]|uniref:Uncharacterized protein n=1 Tax=Vagococcus penaei TaxID=633807 RepID=A0A1Q2D5Y6_9ENTE|nr:MULTISPECIES: hypothetical protein [Vagococcus]AQP53819.1 hypothetical protein BW732_05915 [Vagococcus penaei]MBO0436212.1 hypothetical protein [Vagococcus fluvialis]RST98348.1 hypothetical protein CBF34_10355 [Vagococcus penaei]